jgi:hypothetical protein
MNAAVDTAGLIGRGFAMLPLCFVANTTFPYDEKLALARNYLQSKDIRGPRPVRRSKPVGDGNAMGSSRRRPRLEVVRIANG